VVSPVFQFNGIAASATVDEGNNWINLTYGPLTLGRPPATGFRFDPSAEPTCASAAVGIAQGAYSITARFGCGRCGLCGGSGVPTTTSTARSDQRRVSPSVQWNTRCRRRTLTAISPNSGAQGTTQQGTIVAVTLTGTNFTPGSIIAITGGGVNQFGQAFVSATQLTTNFVIGTNAALGDRTVTVSDCGVQPAGVTFTVVAPAAAAHADVDHSEHRRARQCRSGDPHRHQPDRRNGGDRVR